MDIKKELELYIKDFEEMAESLEQGNGETWDTQDVMNWQSMADNFKKLLEQVK
jgi:hypothetical protein